MPLRVEAVKEEDFATMLTFVHSVDGSLTAPAIDIAFPTETDDAATKRNQWSIQQQLDIFKNDSTGTWLKVVDTDQDSAILSIARWHFYETGYQPSDLEYAGVKDKNEAESYPPEMSMALYRGILEPVIDGRSSWMGKGPFWVLTTLRTREPHRRRGAGGLLVRWGVEKARQDGCPAYLEAVADAAGLYRANGFRDVEPVVIDLHPFGIPSEVVLSRMAANA